ncbi:DUF1129 domain-containing protein [Streptococcus ovuberis]|uniref:DUF1129 domain-containing protein n=1 Tax=Streptococcus ovuberis TaxID=1936207 RepID=A0A7X6S0T2_9STRE|nr:DUF1129 family protein [Streptococcus ovuberis]NKZ19655.1 DUF1129 domain-containing protein [Streptococcus ovuberis]
MSQLEQLTKKNQEFIHIATNHLIKNGKSDSEIKETLSTILPTIMENQSKGITARQLFGAPTAWVDNLIIQAQEAAANPPQNENPWLMWLDASLFILGIMAVMMGILSFSRNQAQTYGVTSLFVLSAATGAMMYAMYHLVYRHLRKPRSERPSGLKTWLILALIMFGVFLIFGLSAFLPASLNPILPGWANLLIGAIGFGGKYLLKQKYNVKSPITSRD